jgi:hypothetical protein
VGAALAVALSGCASSAPPLTVYGGLVERCVETRTTAEGFMALLGTTVVNDTPRTVILRDALPLDLVNATVDDIAVVPLPSPESGFGVAPGGSMTPEQLVLWRGREPLYGATIGPYGAVSVVVQLRADDYREYAGLGGLRLKYDDGWFSATSVGGGDTGFVPPWAHCSSR